MTHKHAFMSLSSSKPFLCGGKGEGGEGRMVKRPTPDWTYIRPNSSPNFGRHNHTPGSKSSQHYRIHFPRQMSQLTLQSLATTRLTRVRPGNVIPGPKIFPLLRSKCLWPSRVIPSPETFPLLIPQCLWPSRVIPSPETLPLLIPQCLWPSRVIPSPKTFPLLRSQCLWRNRVIPGPKNFLYLDHSIYGQAAIYRAHKYFLCWYHGVYGEAALYLVQNIPSAEITVYVEVRCWSLLPLYESHSSISTLQFLQRFIDTNIAELHMTVFWYGPEMVGTKWCLPPQPSGNIYHVNRPHQHSSVSHKGILPKFPN
jgi:hypothetical protein